MHWYCSPKSEELGNARTISEDKGGHAETAIISGLRGKPLDLSHCVLHFRVIALYGVY